ncbi:MAG TPA: hypothetical protein VFW06_02540 [Acidimicrobiia bacterium]|nr:hypothetical protein [Acidimicrobiia bacterium]
MSEWLVPVSQWVRFVGRGGRAVESSVDALQAEVLTGGLERFVCEVRGPLVDARAGDLVWCFVPDGDIGVVAVGRAKAPTKGKQPAFVVSLDRPRSRVLAADPLPAPTIRRWVPELRQGSVRLDPRPRALAVLDGWLRERNARDVEMLATLPASPWRATATRGEKGLALAAHDVVGPISRMLRSQDFALGLGKGAAASPSEEPRIIARRVRDVVVLDVCRIASGRGRAEALAAIGPLLETKWRLERARRDERLRVTPWVAFSARPHAEVVAFIEESGLLVSWTQRGGVVELTDRSKQRWYQYLGVR